jgi:lipid A ethanolaminephosphotransferase
MLQTDMKESVDLLSLQQVLYFVFLGLLPAYIIYKLPLHIRSYRVECTAKLKQLLVLTLIMGLTLFGFFKHFSSFAREHKPLRYTANPTYWLYSVGKYVSNTLSSGKIVVSPTGMDAKVVKSKDEKPKLVIMVVGEATRADHLKFNGYSKNTTPQLEKEEIVNLENVFSCGTSTAVSVPCMFSYYPKSDYSYKKGIRKENVLDVLNHTKNISILWRDNNSDSKGVALRVPYENYKNNKRNTVCIEGECRDEGMLVGLESYIEKQKNKDVLIVLHQMGNHGPAYYKRYTQAFETFTPVCKTNQLEACTKEEINNAYDNALRYTDDFLVKTIGLLKQYNQTHQTAMLYMSDHGESLGENGIYLHGMPYFMAPDAQVHIATLLWENDAMKTSFDFSKIPTSTTYTQDYLFHSLLGLFKVKTKVYDETLDLFKLSK